MTITNCFRINDTMVNEQLFFQIPIFLTENFKVPGINQTPPLTLDHFCVCGKKETNPLSLDDLNTTQCQLTSTTDYCVVSSATIDSRLPTESLNCLASGRIRKRSVNSKSFNRRSIESDDGLEFHPLAYDDDVYSENITVGFFVMLCFKYFFMLTAILEAIIVYLSTKSRKYRFTSSYANH